MNLLVKRSVLFCALWLCTSLGYATSVVKILSIEELQSLSFGSIKVFGIVGSISVSPDAQAFVSTFGGVYSIPSSRQLPSQLRLSGEPNTLVFITIQQHTQLLSQEGKKLALDLELNNALRHLGVTGVIDDVYIGGTLSVGANASAGDYQGDFSITVDYQ